MGSVFKLAAFMRSELMTQQCAARWLRTASCRVVPVIVDDQVVPSKQTRPAVPGTTSTEHTPQNDRPRKEVNRQMPRKKFFPDDESDHDKLARLVTPLWRMPYSKQLQIKHKNLSRTMRQLGQRLQAAGIDFPVDPQNLPCPLRPVLPSPVVEQYRNKDEFSIRQGPDGAPKTVGFLLGSPSGGDPVVCVSPERVVVCKESHRRVAQVFQEYIQRSPLPGCYETHFHGHWKNLVVRSNSAGQLMAIIVMHPQQLTPEELCREKEALVEHFVRGPGSECGLSSLYFQACRHSRCSHAQAPFELLHGQPHLEEMLGGLRFRISPESFFQVNSAVAVFLYDTVRQLLDPGPHASLLDVCCGTGTIGLTLARQLHSVFGIDVSAQAIEDAAYNAQLNACRLRISTRAAPTAYCFRGLRSRHRQRALPGGPRRAAASGDTQPAVCRGPQRRGEPGPCRTQCSRYPSVARLQPHQAPGVHRLPA
ncbi:tRNA (uracil-5-)-methyltransferase homolog B-like isoform X2 [Amblyomma americanum]